MIVVFQLSRLKLVATARVLRHVPRHAMDKTQQVKMGDFSRIEANCFQLAPISPYMEQDGFQIAPILRSFGLIDREETSRSYRGVPSGKLAICLA